jgi:MFS family permease
MAPTGTRSDAGRLDRLYQALANEEDARVCKEISDEACREVPSSFFRLFAAFSLTKLGDALISPKTTLTWVMGFVGAPAFLVAWLVPLRESGSLLPQLILAAWVRRQPRRKWAWVTGSILQTVALAGIAAAAALLRGAAAGWTVVGLLVGFSLARGLSSVAAKDVIGKTIPKTRRGRVTGLASTVAGTLTVGIGLALMLLRRDDPPPLFYAGLLAGASVLWLLAAAVFAAVDEQPGATEGGGNALAEAVARLALLRDDASFRRFVIARSLLLCSALSAPWYVVLARERAGGGLAVLALFLVANGLASSLSAFFWGRLADVSSRRTMVLAGGMAAGLGVALAAVVRGLPSLAASAWLYPAAFFLLGIAHSGVRVGRKTYIVDMAGGNRRTDYVAVSNTVIGAVLLLTGAVGALSTFLPPEGILLFLSIMGLAGALLSAHLPEVED